MQCPPGQVQYACIIGCPMCIDVVLLYHPLSGTLPSVDLLFIKQGGDAF